jgi:hypothetical protein
VHEKTLRTAGLRWTLLASVTSLLLLPSANSLAQQTRDRNASAAAAHQIANFFGTIGDQIYEDCIFELSPEQVEVQTALINAYINAGASSALARRLAVKQIQPPKLSEECERIRRTPKAALPKFVAPPWIVEEPKLEAPPKLAHEPPPPELPPPSILLANKKVLPQWDCAPNVDYVTIHLNGYERKLTDGEICNPYEDVVHEVPDTLGSFRFGYTISTGRLFVVSDDPSVSGRTIAWAISGRDVCRNNPDPDCLAAKTVGSLPPGEYSFAADKEHRVTWGPKTKRNVAAIYLRKLWDKDRFSAAQRAAMLKRGNIAIHLRLKGEMSEACLGLEPKGWAYVASLIKEGRATAVNVYLDEPYPQVAENPPVVVASSFSLTSLFK